MQAESLSCSFCGKTQLEVKKLIVGPTVYICNECVELCSDIINEENKSTTSSEFVSPPSPKEIYGALDEYVIGQESAKLVLAVAVYNHYKRLQLLDEDSGDSEEIQKSNILLVGPTGTGKTLLAKTLAKLLSVPFATADATSLTEAGYVGEDVENILLRLLQAAEYDIQKAERGIIYIDEIDKLARKSENLSITRDVSGEGVQQNLLKIIEGTIASVPQHGGRKHPQQDLVQMNTNNILFICGGTFMGIESIISSRRTKGSIGFGAAVDSKEKMHHGQSLAFLEEEDLIRYGMMTEFIGRLPIIATLSDLDQNALVDVLVKPKNAIIKQFQRLFKIDKVDLIFEHEALVALAKKALAKKVGARGLRSIIEKLLINIMYNIKDYEDHQIVITKETVEKDEKPLIRKISMIDISNMNQSNMRNSSNVSKKKSSIK